MTLRGAVVAAALVPLIATCTSPPVPPPGHGPAEAPRVDGPIRVRGDALVDRSGRPVRLLAVAEAAMFPGSGPSAAGGGDACAAGWAPPSRADVARIANDGFNTVRVAISWANLEPLPPRRAHGGGIIHRWNEPYLHALDRAIAELAARHLAVVLDMHQGQWSPAVKDVLVYPPQELCEGAGMPSWLYARSFSGDEAATKLDCAFFSGSRAFTRRGLPEGPERGLAAAWSLLARRYRTSPTSSGRTS